jgi:hypothetical protein
MRSIHDIIGRCGEKEENPQKPPARTGMGVVKKRKSRKNRPHGKNRCGEKEEKSQKPPARTGAGVVKKKKSCKKRPRGEEQAW